MSVKLDFSKNPFKLLEYFSMANWRKLEILTIMEKKQIINPKILDSETSVDTISST